MTDIAALTIPVDSTDIVDTTKDLGRLDKQADKTERATGKLEGGFKSLNTGAKRLATVGIAGVTAGVVAAGAAVVKSISTFSKLETALVNVQKTTDFSASEMDSLRASVFEMAREIPVATEELLNIAGVAGQLGIKGVGNIEKFTETMGKLTLATDIVGEEGATSIARLLNVTGDGIETVDEFGSVLVALGNDSAATESEILKLGTEVAQATSVFAVSSSETIALGAAMRSMGVRAELGGSVVGRAMRSIEASIDAGGNKMQELSQITGIAADDLEEAFGDNATEVFSKWLRGVGKVIDGGGSAATVLERFGLKGEEVLKVLPTMATNFGLVEDSLELANDELGKGTALNEEAAQAADTLGSKWKTLKNRANEVFYEIGDNLAPTLGELIDDFGEWYDINDELIKQEIQVFFEGAADKAGDLKEAIQGVNEMIGGYKDRFDNLVKLNSSLGGAGWEWGLIGAMLLKGMPGAAALTAALTVVNRNLEHFGLNFGNLIDSSKGFGDAVQNIVDVFNGERDWWTGEYIGGMESALEDTRDVLTGSTGLTAGIEASTDRLKKFGEMARKSTKETEDQVKDSNQNIVDDTEDTAREIISITADQAKDVRTVKERNQEAWERTFERSVEGQQRFFTRYSISQQKEMQEMTDSWMRDQDDVERHFETSLDNQKNDTASFTDYMGKAFSTLFGEIQEDGTRSIGEIQDKFGDWASNLVTGEFSSIGDAWDSLWKGMLGTVVNTVAEMAATFVVDTVVGSFFHSGTLGVKSDEYRAVLQEGEMVIPSDDSDKIRKNIGAVASGGNDGASFDAIVYATERASKYGDVVDEAWSGPVGSVRDQDSAIIGSVRDQDSAIIGRPPPPRGDRGGEGMSSSAGTHDPTEVSGIGASIEALGPSEHGRLGGVFGGAIGYAAPGYMGITTPGSKSIGRGLGTIGGTLVGEALGKVMGNRELEGMRGVIESGKAAVNPFNNMHGYAQFGPYEEVEPSTVSGIMDAYEEVASFVNGFIEDIADKARNIFSPSEVIDSGLGPTGLAGGIEAGTGATADVGRGIEAGTGRSENVGGEAGGRGGGGTGGGTGGETEAGTGAESSYALGGVVDRLMVPQGDDGFAALKLGEGVVDPDTMNILSKQIKSGDFGGGDINKLIETIKNLSQNFMVKVYLDGQELKATIDDVVVERSSRGIPSDERVY